MSKVIVNLEKSETVTEEIDAAVLEEYQKPKKRGIFVKVLGILGVVILTAVVVGAISAFFYWQYLKTTPQYSLALLVDAARRDDQKAIDELINMDEIVDDFVPQIVDQAVELYGRGVAPGMIKRIAQIATPIIPVVKQRARAELPDLIREKTKAYEKIPFWAMALGADRYLEIKQKGEKAIVKSRDPKRLLKLEMKRKGDKWQIVAIKDERLARNIAGKIGQEMIAAAKNRGEEKITELGDKIGIKNLGDLLKQAEEIFK